MDLVQKDLVVMELDIMGDLVVEQVLNLDLQLEVVLDMKDRRPVQDHLLQSKDILVVLMVYHLLDILLLVAAVPLRKVWIELVPLVMVEMVQMEKQYQ